MSFIKPTGITARTSLLIVGAALAIAPSLQAQGSAATAVCMTCHGPEALAAPAVPGVATAPSLNGQHADYLLKQLREFKAGKRKNDLMVPILAPLGGGDFKALAAHFAGLPPTKQAGIDASLAARGRALYEQGNDAAGVPACIGCHLENASGTDRYPRLAGQRQPYLVQQMANFKTAARANDRAHVMRNVAKGLSDDDVRALAAYLAGL